MEIGSEILTPAFAASVCLVDGNCRATLRSLFNELCLRFTPPALLYLHGIHRRYTEELGQEPTDKQLDAMIDKDKLIDTGPLVPWWFPPLTREKFFEMKVFDLDIYGKLHMGDFVLRQGREDWRARVVKVWVTTTLVKCMRVVWRHQVEGGKRHTYKPYGNMDVLPLEVVERSSRAEEGRKKREKKPRKKARTATL